MDRALAPIVLPVEPSLLYLIGDPKDLVKVWMINLRGKHGCRRQRLYILHLQDGDSVQENVKTMTEIFNSLAVIGNMITDEDHVVYLLASLLESYSMLALLLKPTRRFR